MDGVYIDESDSIQFFGGWVATNNMSGIRIRNSEKIVVSGTRIHDNNNGSTHSGIYIIDSYENIFSDIQIWDSVISQSHAYGIREAGISNFNMITSSNVRNATTVNIFTSGTNTSVQFSWNGTTWIP